MFLMGLGDQLSADLLRDLEADEIRSITTEIALLETVSPDHMLHVFREFENLAVEGQFFAKGGADFARRLIEQALGSESANKLLTTPAPESKSNPEMAVLQETDPQQLAEFLRDENPQTIALVLSNLKPARAGALLSSLPAEIQPQVALRMASLDRVAPDVFRRISEAIGTRLKAVRQVSRSDGIKSLAALLNHVDPGAAETILARLEESNQAVSTAVRDLMFVFEDILSIDKDGMKAVLAKLDRRILTTALKGTTGEIRSHFTQCMSQRASEMLVEDMEALGPVRIRDVHAAQQSITTLVRQLQQTGVISAGRGGGDDYVV
jgi:flagellar motor switch protein FliG